MFRESLQRMVDRLSGGVAGILMGFDGISVESYTKDSESGVDIQTVGMELAHALGQMRKANEMLDVGSLNEVTLRSEKLTILVCLLNADYFVACAVRPDANFGQARYYLRVLVPQIRAEL